MAVSKNDIRPGMTISFSTWSSAILTDQWKSVKVVGQLDYKRALGVSANISTTHIQIYPSIQPPNSTSKNPRDLTYWIIEQLNGDTVALATDWIVEDSIVVNALTTYTVIIESKNGNLTEDIRIALESNRIPVKSISKS